MNVTVEFENNMPKVTQIIYKKLKRRNAFGIAYTDTGIIELDPRLKGIKDLEIRIHEITHITLPFLSEEAVIDHSAEMARWLWKSDYRRHDSDTSTPLQDEEE
jgi:hypothetical protein